MEERGSTGGGKPIGGRERVASIGVTEEISKRKRDELEKSFEQEVFQRSKKTGRSPVRDDRMERMMEEIRDSLKEMRKEMREQGMKIREEIDEMKRELGEQLREGREERECLREELERLNERVKKLEQNKINKLNSSDEEGVAGDGEMNKKLKGIERKLELKDREERRKNVIIRGLKVEGEDRKKKVEEIMDFIGAKVDVIETKRLAEDREKGREMVWVRLKDEEQRREIWGKKSKLRGRKERIGEDLTWRERKMKWLLEDIAREEEREGRRVWLRYGRIRINEVWWRWDEDEEVLRDNFGRIREVVNRKGGGAVVTTVC